MPFPRFLMAAAAVLSCSAVAFAADPLSEQQIRDKVTGNTVTIVTQNMDLAVGYMTGDGKIRGHIGAKDFEGSWSIRNGELCFDLPEETFDICRRVFASDQYLNLFTTTGQPAGRIQVLEGNHYGL